MKKLILLCLVAGLVTACATGRTKYQPHGEAGGYSEQKVDDKVMVARFAGNAHTHPNDAFLFSQFRAVEVCKEQGFKIARLYGSADKSTSQTVQRTYQAPTYFSGNANSNTNYNYFGGGYGQANTNTNISGNSYGGGSTTWNETYRYPVVDTYFSCTNQAYMTKVKLKIVSADDMKPFVKDLMGAVQVEDFIEDSPNRDALQVGDFIVKVDGSRVQNTPQFISAIDGAKDKDKIVLNIIRDGNPMVVRAKAIDSTPFMEGENNKLIATACTVPEVKERPVCPSAQRLPANK